MDYSKLKRRITFLKPTQQANNTGEVVDTFSDYVSKWANVVPLTGKEFLESQKLRSETTYKIAIRYCADITSDMKINYNGLVLEIISVINVDGRNDEMLIVAFEV